MTKLIRGILFGCVLFAAVLAAAENEKPDIGEFRSQILAHRERVLLGAQRIFRGQPRYFPTLQSLPPEISQKLIDTYMGLHDLPKVMTKAQLRRVGYDGPTTLLRSLHSVFGIHLDPKPAFIQTLNDIEEAMKIEEMGRILRDLDPSLRVGIWHELRLLEKVADITDTKIYRAVELNFVYRQFEAEKYFRAFGEKVAAYLSFWYESHYQLVPALKCRSAQARPSK
jgi:hypothetical protein